MFNLMLLLCVKCLEISGPVIKIIYWIHHLLSIHLFTYIASHVISRRFVTRKRPRLLFCCKFQVWSWEIYYVMRWYSSIYLLEIRLSSSRIARKNSNVSKVVQLKAKWNNSPLFSSPKHAQSRGGWCWRRPICLL